MKHTKNTTQEERSQIIGPCRLCLRPDQILQDSHFIPGGALRRLRSEFHPNPNPFRMGRKRWVQDSKPTKDHLLCHDCEERFNKGGENWFLKNCWRNGDFPLRPALEQRTPAKAGELLKIYHTSPIAEIDNAALVYFAASEFWRASAHRWKDTRGITLGPYEEHLRNYLRGETPFPKDCALWVSISEATTPMAGMILSPYGERIGTCHFYKLVVLGVGFNLLVGKRIPLRCREMCFVRGASNPIFMTDMLEAAILKDVERKHQAEPRLMASLQGAAPK